MLRRTPPDSIGRLSGGSLKDAGDHEPDYEPPIRCARAAVSWNRAACSAADHLCDRRLQALKKTWCENDAPAYHRTDPAILRIFRRIIHQTLAECRCLAIACSDDAFEQHYPDEEAFRKAWFAWRWPEGFKCPRCAQTEYWD